MELLYTEISGTKFNEVYNGIKFYKFLNNNLIHNKFEYKLGLNEDILPFNPKDACEPGGLYFCRESKCHKFYTDYGTKLALIEIPDDARVYIESNKFKSNKLIVIDIVSFDNVPDEFWINILNKDGLSLQYVKEQTEDVCTLAVKRNGNSLKYVKNQTEELCTLAVKQNGCSLRYVSDQFKNKELCTLAVNQNAFALEYVDNQTEELCKLAVQQKGRALKFVKDQIDELCMLAVKTNSYALKYVINQTDEICTLAVKEQPDVLQYVRNRTDKLCRLAADQIDELYRCAIEQNQDPSNYVIIPQCLLSDFMKVTDAQ